MDFKIISGRVKLGLSLHKIFTKFFKLNIKTYIARFKVFFSFPLYFVIIFRIFPNKIYKVFLCKFNLKEFKNLFACFWGVYYRCVMYNIQNGSCKQRNTFWFIFMCPRVFLMIIIFYINDVKTNRKKKIMRLINRFT